MTIDLTKFKKIDEWHLDNYTEHYTISVSDRKFSYSIHKSIKIDGSLRKGSYIAVTKAKNKIVSADILTQAEFNKLQKVRAA